MNLLGAVNYDPIGGAVSKVTTSLLAMTAFDTTNLRIAFTVPAHGMVTVKMTCIHHGSTTTAQVWLGCLEGSTLRGRAPVTPNLLGTAVATTMTKLDASFTLTGLTPGAVNWDAAYGVEIVSSANGAIKYGGPNNTTTNDGFGGFNFEIWDPRPLGVTQTAGDIVALINAVDDLIDTEVGAIKTETASIQTDTNDIQARLPAALTAGGNIKADILALDGGTQSATDLKDFADAGYDPSTNKVQGVVLTDTVTTYTGNTPQTGDVFPLASTEIADIKAKTDNLPSDPADASVVAGLIAAIDTKIDTIDNFLDLEVAAIKAVTDALPNAGALTTIQADLDNIQTRLPAALSGDGFMKADMKSIDDELTSGNNATLNLRHLHIIDITGSDYPVFIQAAGDGGLDAVRIRGDSDFGGAGVNIAGANGIAITGDNDIAVDISTTGTNKDGLRIQGSGTGKSINAPQDIQVSDGELTLAAIASAVWANATRTLTSIADSSGVTTLLSRITAILGIYTAADVRSSVGLASANLDTQLDALPTAAENATSVWASGTRTLTSFGTLVADVWANATRTLTAISDSAGVTTLLSRIAGALNISGGKVESNIKEVNDVEIDGDGSTTPWGPA